MIDYKLIKDKFEHTRKSIDDLESIIDTLKNEYFLKLKEVMPELDFELMKEFFRQPYAILPKEQNSYYVVVPKWVNFSVGWLERATESYNVFVIDKYTAWLGQIPEEMKELIEFKEAEPIKVFDHTLQFKVGMEEKIKRKYGDFLSDVKEGYAYVRPSKEFSLIAKIIDEGSLPFSSQPVKSEDLRDVQLNFNLEGKYSFQKEAYQKFLQYGAVGVYWMMGSGKSFFAMYCLDSLKGNKVIVVPTRTLIDQWNEYLKTYAPRLVHETEVVTYNSYHKLKNKDFVCVIFDECHRLPANTYSRLATLKTKYRIGLSASPYREDGRHSYIFALTGFPLGLDWKDLLMILGKEYHDVYLHIVKTKQQKIIKLKELLNPEKKTIIFCDGIDFGKQLSARLSIPFVYGATQDRLDVVRTNKHLIASRVLDLGLSDKELEHIIEVDFLYGSRQQELQRTGRLFHSIKGRHDIIMTEQEYMSYRKRLYALVEKGFKINLVK